MPLDPKNHAPTLLQTGQNFMNEKHEKLPIFMRFQRLLEKALVGPDSDANTVFPCESAGEDLAGLDGVVDL